MAIREFLRGGYLELREGTVVTRHGQPMFTVMPFRPENRTEPHRTGQNAAKTSGNAKKRRNGG